MKLETMEQAIVRNARRLATLKYYPSDEYARQEIMRTLARITDRPDRLEWLVEQLIDHVGEWPGPAQLRALYATRWRPADGMDGVPCELAGFTPADSESQNLIAHASRKAIEQAAPMRGLEAARKMLR